MVRTTFILIGAMLLLSSTALTLLIMSGSPSDSLSRSLPSIVQPIRDLSYELQTTSFSNFTDKLLFSKSFTETLGELSWDSPHSPALPHPTHEDAPLKRGAKYARMGELVKALDIFTREEGAEARLWETALRLWTTYHEAPLSLCSPLTDKHRSAGTPSQHSLSLQKSCERFQPPPMATGATLTQSLARFNSNCGRHCPTAQWLQFLHNSLTHIRSTDELLPLSEFLSKTPPTTLPNIKVSERGSVKGVDLYGNSKGLAVEDFNQDGLLDIVVADSFGPTVLLLNRGADKAFVRHDQSGLSHHSHAYSVVTSDYNNDRCVDLFLTRPFHKPALLQNNCLGTFTDVTDKVGLAPPSQDVFYGAWHSAWGDIDLDGDLDLFISSMGQRIPFAKGVLRHPPVPSRLYRNDDGYFEDVSFLLPDSASLEHVNYMAASFVDLNGDRYPDLLLGSFSAGRSRRLLNRRGKQFVDHTPPSFSAPSFTFSPFLSSDGKVGFVRSGNSQSHNSLRSFYALPQSGDRMPESMIYHPTSLTGTSDNSSPLSPIHFPFTVLGLSSADINQDGCTDWYLGTGNPEPWNLVPNALFLSYRSTQGQCAVSPWLLPNGFRQVEPGQAGVFADFDMDGDLDLYAAKGGMWPGMKARNELFELHLAKPTAPWIHIQLKGTRSNTLGIGAHVSVTGIVQGRRTKLLQHLIHNGSGYGSAPYRASATLPEESRDLVAEVTWPSTGRKERYSVLPNTVVTLLEGGGLNG